MNRFKPLTKLIQTKKKVTNFALPPPLKMNARDKRRSSIIQKLSKEKLCPQSNSMGRRMKLPKNVDNDLNKSPDFYDTFENKNDDQGQQSYDFRYHYYSSNIGQCVPNHENNENSDQSGDYQIQLNCDHDDTNKTDKFNESADFDGSFENNNSSNYLRHGQERNYINSRENFHYGDDNKNNFPSQQSKF